MTDSNDFDPGTEHGPIAWMAKNAVASNVLMLILIVGGLVTLASGIKQEVFPEVELDMVSVNITYPGASPAEVEQAVVLAVEEHPRRAVARRGHRSGPKRRQERHRSSYVVSRRRGAPDG